MSTTVERLRAALTDRYRIERELGAGGMATVYLAADLKHDRKVALKVLKPELAAVLGAERFVVEIKTTAALQHPHILPLFDSGTADGFLYYVMPFIDGETLRDKLNRETQLSVDDAVSIASDVADALDYAHRHGVIHRDIKPENILLHDGRPMVADFGIALAVSAAAGGRMTETGLSLGTPHYMSPEQATAAKDITGRSDVYSLGSVLYEMLTGNPPHVGATAQQIIMKIVTEDAAPVTQVRKSVPRNVAAAVARSLEKLPADRFASAAEFRNALRDSQYSGVSPGDAAGTSVVASLRRGPNGALIGVAAAAAIAAVWGWARQPAEAPVTRYRLAVSGEYAPTPGSNTPVALPDGSGIVYIGPVPNAPGVQLWIKRREHHDAAPLPGTLGAASFAISPDGEWVAFAAGPQLRKVPIAGGAAVPLVSSGVASLFGLAWLDNGTLVFVQQGATLTLGAVSENGGDARVLWSSDRTGGVLPAPLPDGRGVLFARCAAATPSACEIWGVGLAGDSGRMVLPGAAVAQYSPTGHLLFVQEGRLLAVEFDVAAMATRGAPVTLADGVRGDFAGQVNLSRSGTLVTQLGSVRGGGLFEMVWLDRTGRETPVDTSWKLHLTVTANNHGWALSPDGRHLAIGLNTEAGDDIWVKELPRGPLSRLTIQPSPEYRPRWTPDGRFVTYIGSRDSARIGMLRQRADGSGSESLVAPGAFDEAMYSPDGNWLLFRQGAAGAVAGGRDVFAMRLGRDTVPVPVLQTSFDEMAVALSPDGRWLAYVSDETGRSEVFIRSFPNTNDFKRQVSNGGGVGPLWSRDGRELFYVSAAKAMMAVRIGTGSPVTVGEAASLFRVPDELLEVESFFYTPWDVAPDGRFIMARARRDAASSAVVIIAENWLTELRQKLGR